MNVDGSFDPIEEELFGMCALAALKIEQDGLGGINDMTDRDYETRLAGELNCILSGEGDTNHYVYETTYDGGLDGLGFHKKFRKRLKKLKRVVGKTVKLVTTPTRIIGKKILGKKAYAKVKKTSKKAAKVIKKAAKVAAVATAVYFTAGALAPYASAGYAKVAGLMGKGKGIAMGIGKRLFNRNKKGVGEPMPVANFLKSNMMQTAGKKIMEGVLAKRGIKMKSPDAQGLLDMAMQEQRLRMLANQKKLQDAQNRALAEQVQQQRLVEEAQMRRRYEDSIRARQQQQYPQQQRQAAPRAGTDLTKLAIPAAAALVAVMALR